MQPCFLWLTHPCFNAAIIEREIWEKCVDVGQIWTLLIQKELNKCRVKKYRCCYWTLNWILRCLWVKGIAYCSVHLYMRCWWCFFLFFSFYVYYYCSYGVSPLVTSSRAWLHLAQKEVAKPASPGLRTFDLQDCQQEPKLLTEMPERPNPPAATGRSHDQRADLPVCACVSLCAAFISAFMEGEELSWMSLHGRPVSAHLTPRNCVAVRGGTHAIRSLLPLLQDHHAYAGEISGGQFHGRYDGWWIQRWPSRRLGSAAQVPVQQTGVPGTVAGRDRVLRGSHRKTDPHPEGDQAAAVVHRLRRVSNLCASIFFPHAQHSSSISPGPPQSRSQAETWTHQLPLRAFCKKNTLRLASVFLQRAKMIIQRRGGQHLRI